MQKKATRNKATRKASENNVNSTLIAVGTRGTSFVMLEQDKLGTLKVNENNGVLAKERFSAVQFEKYIQGGLCGALWMDSASWISKRGETFWIGTLAQAIAQKRVVKAIAHVKAADGSVTKHECYVRSGFDCAVKLDKQMHTVLACADGTLGRFEAYRISFTHDGLKGNNHKYARNVSLVELA